jgi:hypothetical protein
MTDEEKAVYLLLMGWKESRKWPGVWWHKDKSFEYYNLEQAFIRATE